MQHLRERYDVSEITGRTAASASAVTKRDIADTGSVRLVESRRITPGWVILRDGVFPARVRFAGNDGEGDVTLTTVDLDGDDRCADLRHFAPGETVAVLDARGQDFPSASAA